MISLSRSFVVLSANALVALFAFSALVAAANAEQKKPEVTTLVGVPITKILDVPYDAKDKQFQRLDAYLVRSDKPTPALIEIHGGGFRKGSKSSGADDEKRFFEQHWVYMRALRAGISVISIDYRLTPKYSFPAQTDDAARAVQFVRHMAKEWNIDPQRIALAGTSAGATLSLWVGLHDEMAKPSSDDPVARESTRVSAIVDISGPVDFARFNPRDLTLDRKGLARIISDYIGCDEEDYGSKPECMTKVKAASPIHFVSQDDPPVMLVYMDRGGRPKGQPPRFLDNPHSAWFGVLMANELSKRSVMIEDMIGRSLTRSKEAEKIVDFLVRQLETKPTPAPTAKQGSGPAGERRSEPAGKHGA